MESVDQKGTKPVPDPTALTTAQLMREIATVREIFEAKLEVQKELLRAHIQATDKAEGLARSLADKMPIEVDAKIEAVRSVHEEKFKSVQTQFTERDTRAEKTAADSKLAVDAAFSAAKEAVGKQNESSAQAISKSELATTKQIDQLNTLINTGNAATDGKITDVKERVTRLEGQTKGHSEEKGDLRANIAIIIAVLAIVLPLVMLYIGK
jgi:cobalamin biosynthesis Mg chelatase CobN